MFNTSVPAVSVSSELCSSDDDRWRVFSLLFVTPVDDRRLPYQQQQHDEEERLDDDAGPSIPLDDFLVLERDFIFMNTTPIRFLFVFNLISNINSIHILDFD